MCQKISEKGPTWLPPEDSQEAWRHSQLTTRKAMLDHRSFCKHTFSVKHSLIEHMKRVHGSDDINKAYCRMENGDSVVYI